MEERCIAVPVFLTSSHGIIASSALHPAQEVIQ